MKLLEPMVFGEFASGLGLPRKYREPHVLVGVDTETVKGLPYCVQTADSAGGESVRECWGQASVVRRALSVYLEDAPPNAWILAAAHYLRFDVQVLFRDKLELFQGVGEIDWIDEEGVHWKGSTLWPVVFVIARKNGRTLLLIDTFKFFFGSLASVARDLQLEHKKLEVPVCIKENRAPTEEEQAEFVEYALTDARVVLGVLKWIDSIWAEADLGAFISIAHQGGKIFNRRFAARQDEQKWGLDLPDQTGQMAGLASYQGGRNSLRSPTGQYPFVVEDCTQLDVKSMYPYVASHVLPPLFNGRWVWDADPKPTDHGILRVYGRVKAAPHGYKLLMAEDGSYLKAGDDLKGTWMTSYELVAAMAHGLIEAPAWCGYVWEGDLTGKHPLRDYYRWVFEQKERARGGAPALYLYYKYLANSLTGKFCSTIPRLRWNNGVLQKYRVPGGMFNAPVGSLITGAARARLFNAEVESSSLHGATDSIVVPPWGKAPAEGQNLGDWEHVTTGTFICARNKLYAFLGKTEKRFLGGTGYFIEREGGVFPATEREIKDPQKRKMLVYKGQLILKYALHAFHGDVFEFLRLILEVDGTRKYTYKRMTQLREAQRRRLPGLQFNQFEAELKSGGKYGG